MGKDPIVGLSKVGLTVEEAQDPAIRLEVRTQIKFLELAAEEVQDEWLGFHLACNYDLREIGLVYYVIASSHHLADALRNAERYSQINNEGVRLRFSLRGGIAAIALDYVDVDRRVDCHHIEFWLVTLLRSPYGSRHNTSEMEHLRNLERSSASTSSLALTPTRYVFRNR
jgi:hypothetical protein